jgi:glyoxylase I family protein
MLRLNKVHHIAIICSDFEKSKHFYVNILGFTIIKEVYRAERLSHKLDLALNGEYVIELFSFPDPPQRVSQPEARGLRHLAFEVDSVAEVIAYLTKSGIACESARIDPFTQKPFTFTSDPDGLPIEFYEK